MKKARVPKILYVGPGQPELVSSKYYEYEDNSLEVHYEESDENVDSLLTTFKPDAIVTVGESDSFFQNLCKQPYEIRKKWIHFTTVPSDIGQQAYSCAMNQILSLDNTKLISYFTPTYNTGVKIQEAYRSLVEQTYGNWEWVIVDDSTDNGKTLSIVKEIASTDSRVRVYSFEEKSKGIIGESKYRAAALCRGFLLAELDHDDLLTDNCTLDLYNASQAFPDAGFFYNDTVEVDENGQSLTYPDGFACEYGKYYKHHYRGHVWDVSLTPNINPKTIRHIVGIPNHIRAWRRETYFAVGGHNRDLSIADDYELVVRTFLHTRFCKIPKLGYIQNLRFEGNEQNTHDIARADIQRRVRTIADHYNEAINRRFKELGVVDWIYETGIYNFFEVPSRFGEDEKYVNYIFTE